MEEKEGWGGTRGYGRDDGVDRSVVRGVFSSKPGKFGGLIF